MRLAPGRRGQQRIAHFGSWEMDLVDAEHFDANPLRARLADAQHVARMGSWDTALASMSVVWSEETHRIFETHPSQFHPTHEAFLERVNPEDRTSVNEAFIRSLDQPEPQTIEHRLLLKDKRIQHITERWQIIRDESGRAIRALGRVFKPRI